jgi:hypothetical protein
MIKLILLIAISFNSFFSHQYLVPVIENTNGFNSKRQLFPYKPNPHNSVHYNIQHICKHVCHFINTNTINTSAMSDVNDFRFAHEATDIVPGDIAPIPKYSFFGMLIF